MFALAVLPITLLNTVGLIIAVIWLMVLGEWRALGVALAAAIIGPLACSFALLPSLLMSVPGVALHQKGGGARLLGFPLLFLSLVWTFSVMCFWALTSFSFYMHHSTLTSYIPMLLLAFGVATGPWAVMAHKEKSPDAALSLFFLQVASALVFLILVFFDASNVTAWLVFMGVMVLGVLTNLVVFMGRSKASAGGVEAYSDR